MSGTDRYARVVARGAELADLNSAMALLGWDQETKMPRKGVSGRAHVYATLSSLAHDKLTDAALGDDLRALAANGFPEDSYEHILVREFLRLHEREAKVPRDLVTRMAELEASATAEWAEARANADFKSFVPTLDSIIRLKREHAEALGYEDEPYDALLDLYEPGMRTRELAPVLSDLRDRLIPMVRRIAEAYPVSGPGVTAGPFDVAKQEQFGREVVTALGFDLESGGRLDVSQHPFSSGIHAGDVRLTTRYADDLEMALFGTIHEAGHGLYEQNLPATERRGPVGQAVSMGIHESQSRLWENMVGRGRPFWVHFFPRLQSLFPEQLGSVTLDTFYRTVNQVQPSFIRIESDEMTYNLHIAVRFELEREFLSGRLATADLEEAWNAKYADYLGVTPPNARVGVLQDIHWSGGMVGYFPTYSLGNLYSAQLFNAARRDLPDLETDMARGHFLGLRDWLAERVHRLGRRHTAKELVQRATGAPVSAYDFVSYLETKFGELYP